MNRGALWGLAWLLVGCGADNGDAGTGDVGSGAGAPGSPTGSGPSWIHLARSDADAEPLQRLSTVESFDGEALELVRTGSHARLVTTLQGAGWSAGERPGLWSCAQPALAVGRPAEGRQPYELLAPGGASPAPRFDADVEHFGDEPGTFTVEGGRVLLCLAPEEEPPESLRLSISASHQEWVPPGPWGVAGHRLGGEGLVVWPTERVEVRRRVPPDSVLRFATGLEQARLREGMRQAVHTFRVTVSGPTPDDPGAPFEHRQTGAFEDLRWHALALPAEGGELTFTFEVEGPFAYTSFLQPVVGPRDVGSYGARPAGWPAAAPDVVVFLADTLRADRLATYGGEAELTPNMDAFARRGLAFRHAWSVSTHTLPTHSSLFSGLYPRQNGQVDFFHPLPRAVDTLAERLSRAGYRTAAVTDGIMVSQTHGMAQGFGVFDERARDLDGTLARVESALAGDDGRPLFLFVQTYAAHAPYPVRAATRERLGSHLEAGASLEELMASLTPSASDPQLLEREGPKTDETLERIRMRYDASVIDLDLAFGSFLGTLEERRLLEDGWLILTSDHGESLGEHDRLFHAGVTYETELRVPLVLHGPGLEPRLESRGVSLIDFTPTVAEIAGLRPDPAWMGRSWLGSQEPRVIYAFQCRGKQSTLAVVDDGRKLIGFEDRGAPGVARWMAAFDIERDPGEGIDLFQGATPWPSELAERYRELVPELLTPRVAPEASPLTPDALRALQAMGYVDSGEE